MISANAFNIIIEKVCAFAIYSNSLLDSVGIYLIRIRVTKFKLELSIVSKNAPYGANGSRIHLTQLSILINIIIIYLINANRVFNFDPRTSFGVSLRTRGKCIRSQIAPMFSTLN